MAPAGPDEGVGPLRIGLQRLEGLFQLLLPPEPDLLVEGVGREEGSPRKEMAWAPSGRAAAVLEASPAPSREGSWFLPFPALHPGASHETPTNSHDRHQPKVHGSASGCSWYFGLPGYRPHGSIAGECPEGKRPPARGSRRGVVQEDVRGGLTVPMGLVVVEGTPFPGLLGAHGDPGSHACTENHGRADAQPRGR